MKYRESALEHLSSAQSIEATDLEQHQVTTLGPIFSMNLKVKFRHCLVSKTEKNVVNRSHHPQKVTRTLGNSSLSSQPVALETKRIMPGRLCPGYQEAAIIPPSNRPYHRGGWRVSLMGK